ncbi:MAG TPA: APC family permease [Terriglobales bacterium]
MTDGPVNSPSIAIANPIGAIGAFSIGIGGIVGGGIFATLGIAANGSRGSTYISFLLGGAIALLTAYSYVHLSLTYPGKGGTVTFIEKGFGNGLFGSSMNVLLVFSYVVLLAVYAEAFGTYAANFFPVDQRHYWHVGLRSAVIVVMAAINLLGPSLVDRSEGFFNVGKLGILAAFVVAGLAGTGLSFSRLGPSDWVSLPKIVSSGMAVFLSYEGFELIANSSDRIRNPRRNVPLAFYGSVVTAIVLYFFIIVVTLGYLSFEALQQAANYPLSAAAEVFMGRTGFILLSVGAILATASAINAGIFGASKLPITLAQMGEAAGIWDREVWQRHPAGLIYVAVCALVISNVLNLHAMSAAASAGFLMVFALVNAANAKLARQTASRAWISKIGAATCILALATMIVQTVREPEHWIDIYCFSALFLLPFVFQIIRRALRP